jgi:mannose-6-phosphate isomerase
MDLYPLKFKPWLRTMVWGGEKIAKFKDIFTTINRIGESWEISAVEGHVSVVENGPLAGKSLTELMHIPFLPQVKSKKLQKNSRNMPNCQKIA